jgi:hypothetical protein
MLGCQAPCGYGSEYCSMLFLGRNDIVPGIPFWFSSRSYIWSHLVKQVFWTQLASGRFCPEGRLFQKKASRRNCLPEEIFKDIASSRNISSLEDYFFENTSSRILLLEYFFYMLCASTNFLLCAPTFLNFSSRSHLLPDIK